MNNNIQLAPKNIFNFKIILLGSILLAFVFINFILSNSKSVKTSSQNTNQNIIPAIKNSTADKNQIPEDVEFKNLVLKKTTSKGDTKIFSIPQSYQTKKVLQWKNNIIFEEVSESSENQEFTVKITSFNFLTQETSVLFSEKITGFDRFGDMKILGNDLYFIIGIGYRGNGKTYYINLLSTNKTPKEIALFSPDQSPLKSGEGYPQTIFKVDNKYFLEGTTGDSCGTGSFFYHLDTDLKKATQVFTTIDGCNEGDSFLGFDIKNRMLLATHTDYLEDDYSYKSVSFVSIDNPKKKIELLSEKSVSGGLIDIKFSKIQNKLLLIGSDISLFNLDTNTIEKIIDTPKDFKTTTLVDYWDNNVICLVDYGPDQIIVKLEINSKKVLPNDEFCTNQNKEGNKERIRPKAINTNKFSLPSDYKLVLE